MRVTHTVEVTGVPVTGAAATSTVVPPTHTVTTHQEVRGVAVSVLDGLPSGQQPVESEGDDLYEINMDFIGDLLRGD